jgi:regulator of protease activity HflC (stomatin/prohibitin superfamily)
MTPRGEPTAEQDKALAEQRVKIKDLIQSAGGKAASLILEASADRWARHMGERARLAAYQGQLRTYQAAPAVYRAALFLDAIKSAMADSRVFIVDGNVKLHFRGDMTDRETIGEIFQAPQ